MSSSDNIKVVLERYNGKVPIALYYGSMAKDALLSEFELGDFPDRNDDESLCFDRIVTDICKIIAQYSKGSELNENQIHACAEEIASFLLNIGSLLSGD